MDWKSVLFLCLAVVFILLAGFFSLTETAFSCVNKYRMEALANQGSRPAKKVLKTLAHFDLTLNTVLLGTNAASVALSVISTTLFLKWLPSTWDEALTSLVASIVVTLLLYVFGETLPKQIGKKIPNKVSLAVVYPLAFFLVLFFPVSIIFYGLSFLLKKLFKGKEEPELTEEDFNAVIEDNQEHGVIAEDETDIIQNSFDFSDTSVKDVLTPKEKMFEIDLKGLTNSQLAEKLLTINYSRIPMYYGDPDKVVGILIVKEYLARYLRDKNVPISQCLEKPYIVSPSIMMDEMVEGFRDKHTPIALVYKDNRLLGMITTEDVLEELVGPIPEKPGSLGEKS
ncbi:MAG: hemolysin family protein [Bacilli bacterium]|nr:hemolysin family protein [Bacilli bacterium]